MAASIPGVVNPTANRTTEDARLAVDDVLDEEMHTGRETYNSLDPNTTIHLRLAVIDNPNIGRPNAVIDYTDTTGVVNTVTAKVCLRWLNMNGGVVRANSKRGAGEHRSSYNVEDLEHGELNGGDDSELVELSYPFIWVADTNWCGFNYMPPVGAKVIVGFAKNNDPRILGYINPKPKHIKPVLKPGEVCVKGYGDNYIVWRQSNKLDIFVGVGEGVQDVDDPTYQKASTAACNLSIRMDADNGFIKLTAGETCLTIEPTGVHCNVCKGGAGWSINEDTMAINSGKTSVNSQTIAMNGRVEQNH